MDNNMVGQSVVLPVGNQSLPKGAATMVDPEAEVRFSSSFAP